MSDFYYQQVICDGSFECFEEDEICDYCTNFDYERQRDNDYKCECDMSLSFVINVTISISDAMKAPADNLYTITVTRTKNHVTTPVFSFDICDTMDIVSDYNEHLKLVLSLFGEREFTRNKKLYSIIDKTTKDDYKFKGSCSCESFNKFFLLLVNKYLNHKETFTQKENPHVGRVKSKWSKK